MPAELYKYPPQKTITTGIPLRAEFTPVTAKKRADYRAHLKLPVHARVIFVIGGGLGSQRVNQAVAEAMPHLLKEFRDLHVVQSVGRANEADTMALYSQSLTEAEQQRLSVYGYIDDVYRYSGAADIVITRAGATNLAEFAVQGKACVVIPSPFLAGGHQLRNADYLAEQGAALVLNEADLLADPHRLAKQVSKLLRDTEEQRQLGQKLATFARPHATAELADVILEQVHK
jgi:UDP-N-acetylglucosamine--N-acetylmuramyl-(pentapeptide) pyrophosphoryl-undecaprenol N-acetylglucosamine transferase